MMRNRLSFTGIESAGLRNRLENCLTAVFADKKISEYLIADCNQNEIQFLSGNTGNTCTFPRVKLAYDIWFAMQAVDRHAVLGQFQCLYAGLPIAPGSRKTLTFCVVFIHEFAGILSEATEWPD